MIAISSVSSGAESKAERVAIGDQLTAREMELLGAEKRVDGGRSVHIDQSGRRVHEVRVAFYILRKAQVMIELQFNKDEEVIAIRWTRLKPPAANDLESDWRAAAEIVFDEVNFKAVDTKLHPKQREPVKE